MNIPAKRSMSAYYSVMPKMSAKHHKVLNHIKLSGVLGCTDEEGQIALGINGNSYRPIRVKLEKVGLIGLNGQARPTKSNRAATVWVDHSLSTMVKVQQLNPSEKIAELESRVAELKSLLKELGLRVIYGSNKEHTLLLIDQALRT
jgi:hypothetical protein